MKLDTAAQRANFASEIKVPGGLTPAAQAKFIRDEKKRLLDAEKLRLAAEKERAKREAEEAVRAEELRKIQEAEDRAAAAEETHGKVITDREGLEILSSIARTSRDPDTQIKATQSALTLRAKLTTGDTALTRLIDRIRAVPTLIPNDPSVIAPSGEPLPPYEPHEGPQPEPNPEGLPA